MNKTKFFDKYMFILSIVGLSSMAISIVLLIIMFLTAQVIYNDEGVVDQIVYHPVLSAIYAIFLSLQLLTLAWFIIRAITYKLRCKEANI